MTVAARKFCKGCLSCTKTKTPRRSPPGFLKPLPLPVRSWTDISIDFVTPLPPCTVRGRTFKHIAVVVDRLTKMRHFIPTESLSAEELCEAFVERIWSLHGSPETIISDRGSNFVSAFWRALSLRLGTSLKPSSAYHPETNGQTERTNQEMEQFLRTYTNWAQDDWALWLPIAEFAGNNAVSSTTGVSPFFANYGFHPRMGIEPQTPPGPKLSDAQRKEFFKANEIANRFKAILDQVTALSKNAQDRYERNANVHRSDAPKYHVGDEVMISTENWKTGRPVRKLAPRFEGPFPVTKTSPYAVEVKLPTNIKIFNTFHVKDVQLRPKDRVTGQEDEDLRANDGRVIVRDDEHDDSAVEWEFQDILGYGQFEGSNRWFYDVLWKDGSTSWEPAANLKGCDDILWRFHNAHPEAGPPRPWLRKEKKG